MKIAGAVRVIKGQEVLPDGSNLEEHGITDGSTVNIVIEPNKVLNLTIKLGPKSVTYNVNSSLRVYELKQVLIDGDTVGFAPTDFTLICADDNHGFAANALLEDESIPLHLCGVGDNSTITIVGHSVMIKLVSQRGSVLNYAFPRSMKTWQLKQTVKTKCKFFDNSEFLVNIWAFLQKGESYRKLQDDVTIGSILSDYDVIHFVEDRMFKEDQMIPVYYEGKEIGRVGGVQGDSLVSLRLRVQEQMGFPVGCVHYKQYGKTRPRQIINIS